MAQGNRERTVNRLDTRAMVIMAPKSKGCGLSGPMRMVAMLLLLWDEDTVKGRIEWDVDQICDRTGLSHAQVVDALDKLRQIHLVKETAAGPKITYEDFAQHTLPAWRDRMLLRPSRM